MIDEQTLQMRVTVCLTRSVMTVLLTEGSELFQPFVNISEQTVLRIVYPDPGSDMHCGNEDHPFTDTAFFQCGFDF